MANLALIQFTVLVVSREGFNSLQAMADQAVIPPVKGVGDARAFFFSLCLSSLGFRLLVAEQAGARLPDHVIVRVRRNPVQIMAGDTFLFMPLHQVRD
jgi:hypothetical protein